MTTIGGKKKYCNHSSSFVNKEDLCVESCKKDFSGSIALCFHPRVKNPLLFTLRNFPQWLPKKEEKCPPESKSGESGGLVIESAALLLLLVYRELKKYCFRKLCKNQLALAIC